jgi:phosphatidylinositol alpha-mannosyltransferase
MAAGAGVVLGGDNPGYRSVLGEQPALLVDPNDTKAFAERLDGLLASQTKRAELHEWQKNEVGQYDINKIGAQLVNVYVKQIAKRSKKGNN